MLDKTITVFNLHEPTGQWIPHVIDNTDAGASLAGGKGRQGDTDHSALSVLIPCKPGMRIQTREGELRYVEPKGYTKSESADGILTFTPGQDFILIGAWDDPAPIAADEYEDGLYDALNDAYDDVFMITSAEYYSLIPHFEIGGR